MKHNRTLRRGLGVLFGLVLCLTLLTVSALAAEPATETADFTEYGDHTEALALLNAAKTEGAEDSEWDSATKTLTLNGVNFTTSNPSHPVALELPAGATIELVGENTITSGDNYIDNYGIYVYGGDLTITGEGKLTVTGGEGFSSHGIYVSRGNLIISDSAEVIANGGKGASKNAPSSYGIYVHEGHVTISGGTVTANGGTVNAPADNSGVTPRSYGIYASGGVTIEGGTVTANGGEADCSYGIYASGDVTIEGGTVKATGGTAQTESYGIYVVDYYDADGNCVGSNLTITGGTVKATGGTVNTPEDEYTRSCGIHAGSDVTIEGGDVTATGGAADYSYGILASGGLTIEGGTVTATGGEADCSYGIYASGGSVTITGGTVTATGGEAYESCGIYADYCDVTIEDGTVEATGCSCGIHVSGEDLIISGGTVTANGGEATGENSEDYGIYVGGDVTIEGGTVTATGYTAKDTSCGIYASGGSVTITGGTVTANGGEAKWLSCGINAFGGDVTISGGHVTTRTPAGGAALNMAPDLSGYEGYRWRTDGDADFTSSARKAYSYSDTHTYVEITDGNIVTIFDKTADFSEDGNPTEALEMLRNGFNSRANWDADAKILTLSGVDFTTTAGTAVILPAGAKIVLTKGTTNTITSACDGVDNSHGILVEGDLTIQGDGQLTATGGEASNSSYGITAGGSVTISDSAEVTAKGDEATGARSWSYGIEAYGDVAISGSAKVTATGGTATGSDSCSYGIYVYNEGDVTITGGTVTATGGEAGSNSYGIYVYEGDVTISGGTVTATGGGAGSDSYGIYVNYGDVTITGGTVTANGGGADNYSYGIYADGDVTISRGTVIARGGTANFSCGIGPYTNIKISGGTVTATGGTATGSDSCSYGICTNWGNVTIEGGTVTATGGTADNYSYGIYAYDGDVTISDGTVTATGGAATALDGDSESSGIIAKKNVSITGGTVEATSGTAGNYSYGIFAIDKNVTISGGTVTATGGEATESYGIYAYENVTISDGTVTATGGTAGNYSYGIYAVGDVTITDSAKVTATGGVAGVSCGIFACGGVSITGGTVIATGGETESSIGICAYDGITISGGHVTARTLAGTDAGTKSALNAAPDLSGYNGYYWRVSTEDSFTTGNYSFSTDHTYVEFSNGYTYTITLDPNYEGGELSTVVTGTDGKLTGDLPVLTRIGYTFDGWFTAAVGGEKVAAETEMVFEKDATFYAHWTKKASSGGGGGGSTTYAITVETAENGAVTASHKSAAKGADVTLTVTPDKGYTLETLTATDKNGDKVKLTDKGSGKYTFTMPASKVTVKATFMEDNSMLNFFVDVPASAYYYDAVLWAAENGVTGGTDAVHFSPDAACTRAQIVTFLWRAAGSPEPKSLSSFADVPADSYYAKAVAWAVENGITTGTGDGMFSPDATCTRAQAMTFLWRSQKSAAADGVNPFTDVAADAYYADAVLWAVENGVTNGTSDTTFSPNADCTRAQIVTFLYRCLGEE